LDIDRKEEKTGKIFSLEPFVRFMFQAISIKPQYIHAQFFS